MKALMLHSENSAVGKYRIWTPAKHLQKLGWDIARIPDEAKRIPIDKGYAGDDTELLESAKTVGSWEELSAGADIIVMQRPDQPESIALAMALREQCDAPLVFEVDDNIYDVAENSTSYQYWYPGSPLFKVAEMLMAEADAITVSTPALVDVYKHLNPNIYVLPNYQDLDDWQGIERPGGEAETIIGWAGSSTHYDDLNMVKQVIKKILRNHKNVKFRMLGFKPDFFADIERVELETSFAPVQSWPERLAKLNFDIGICPVVNRPFNMGKSDIKWQEYSMLGIPTVASKPGPYAAIEPGVTGFLASSPDEWLLHLERLIKSAELRTSIGEAAKRFNLTNNTIDKNIGQWNDAYRDIIGRYKSIPGTQSKLARISDR